MHKLSFSSPRFLAAAFAAIALLLAADQWTKWAAFEWVLRVDGAAIPFGAWLVTCTPFTQFLADGASYAPRTVTPFLNIVMVWNTGVSFGMLDGGGDATRHALTALALVVAAGMSVWLALSPRRLTAAALVLVAAGALGNAIDRLRFGAVADFVDLHVAGWHWPAFNLADSCIVAGAILLVVDSFLHERKNKTEVST